MMNFTKHPSAKDLKTNGRVIVAEGEATGHVHEVIDANAAPDSAIPAMDFFEEPNGRRILLVTRPCLLRHDEHDPIALDPTRPEQVRQGDVLLHPIGDGAWQVIRQREYSPEALRQVAD
jgi:hypothetical protein